MKKGIILIIICFLFTACGRANENKNNLQNDNKNSVINNESTVKDNLVPQKYTFGPKVKEEEVSEETKKELQTHLNKLGNPEKDNISFNGFSAKFRQDGALVLSVFIRNGYSYIVHDIEAKVDLKKHNEVIATATFNLTEDEFGSLNPGETRVWNLVYEPQHILNKNVDLNEYLLEYSTKYNRK